MWALAVLNVNINAYFLYVPLSGIPPYASLYTLKVVNGRHGVFYASII